MDSGGRRREYLTGEKMRDRDVRQRDTLHYGTVPIFQV